MSNASNSDSDTRSLDSEVMEKSVIHGREYQPWSMDRGASSQPVDEIELERQDKIYEALQEIFDKRLVFPRGIPSPKKVLECGFGIGSWAIEMAETYPDCDVLGIDVSPHLKPDVQVENLTFQIDDLNERFTFEPNSFDLVHSQCVVTGIKQTRWATYIQDCVSSVKWDRDIRVPQRFDSMFRENGLESIDFETVAVPMNGWYGDSNPIWKAHGERFGAAFGHGLEGSMMIPLTNAGVSAEQVRVLVAQARRELEDPVLKPYMNL